MLIRRKRLEEERRTYIAVESDFDRELRQATERLEERKEREKSGTASELFQEL